MDREGLLEALARETAAFAAGLRAADLHTPVTACPGWDVRALAAHLAGVHRWARNAVVDGEMREDPTPPLDDRGAVVAWYEGSAALLRSALQAAPAGTACPGFGPRPRTVDFWVRRQPHETAVHRWDLGQALGHAAVLDPELSADGVDEVVTLMLPRQLHLGRCAALPAAVAMERTDGPERWVVGDGPPAATVRAPAAELLLLLWRRGSVDDVETSGDADLARAVLSLPLAP